MKLLFFADVIGKPGRTAVAETLPKWREEHKPDLIIANAENSGDAGHGFGAKELTELTKAGVEAFTSGDHFVQSDFSGIDSYPIVRPVNTAEDHPGVGVRIVETAGHKKVLLINLLGKAFMSRVSVTNFFDKIEEVLDEYVDSRIDATFIDFHAETTSETNALSYQLDGKVSALVGTHTHVPTADTRIMPKGTAYQTDVGMCGSQNSVIGFKLSTSLQFLRRDWDLNVKSTPAEVEDSQPYICDTVLIDTIDRHKSRSIERLTTRQ